MKKSILIIMIFISCNILFAQDVKAKIEKVLNVNLKKLSSIETIVPNGYGVKYQDVNIHYYVIKYSEDYLNDYWSPEVIRELYKGLRDTNKYSYLFSVDEKIKQVGDRYNVDYFVFSMFEQDDVRLERILGIFDYKKATIIKVMSTIDEERLNNDLVKIGLRIIKPYEGRYWKKYPETLIEFGESIREGKIEIDYIKRWYSISEKIKNEVF